MSTNNAHTSAFKYSSLFKRTRNAQRNGWFQGSGREHKRRAKDIFCQKVKEVWKDQGVYIKRKQEENCVATSTKVNIPYKQGILPLPLFSSPQKNVLIPSTRMFLGAHNSQNLESSLMSTYTRMNK